MAWKGNWGKSGGAPSGGAYGGGKGGLIPKGGGKAGIIKPNIPASNMVKPSQPARPVIAPASGAVKIAPAAGGKTPAFTVSSSSSKKDEIGVQTLVGDYTEFGSNHGRKYYKKVQDIPGHKDVKVFLYYWDNRDGADFSGWWFGDELGGSQVWARCSSAGNVPPPAGWKIPWDAPKAEPGLLTVNTYKAKPGVASAASVPRPGQPVAATAVIRPGQPRPGQPAAGGAASVMERVKKATAQFSILEKSSNEVVARAKSMSKDSPADALKKMQDSLTAEQTKLNDAQRSLTQDINEARKAGPSAVTSVTELSKLSPRFRAATTSLATELNKIKSFATQAAQQKQTAAGKEAQKKQEEKNSEEFEEALPVVEEACSAAEDAVEAVSIMAAPIINDPPEDAGASMTKVMDEIESAANTAQTKLTQSRTEINAKLAAARAYAPETRKKALAEYTSMQTKLAEAQKKLNPFKSFKRDFNQRVEAKKALSDITEKLSSADLEVEKASMMTTGADSSQMSDEDVKSAEELVTPARQALGSVSALVEQKLRQASGPMKDELTGIKTRLLESQKKVNDVAKTLKRQREGLQLASTYTEANEKVGKAEDSLDKCSDAELSFLKGIEILPKDESDKAIKDSEAASSASSTLVNQAISFLIQKLQEVKRYSPETSKKATEELQELQKRVDAVKKKLTTFKNETQERKVAAMMADAIDSVAAAESKGKAVAEAAKVFETDNLDNVTVDALKEASTKTAAADKECQAAISQARKVVVEKQRTEKDREALAGLSKLTNRINNVQQELAKVKRAASTGDRLVKGKEVIADAETKLSEVEAEVAKVVKLSKPEDEGLGVEKIADGTILDMDSMSTVASKSIRAVSSLVVSQLANAPPAIKSTLEKLSSRCKKAEASLAEVKVAIKEQREQVLSQSYVKEGLEKTLAVEAALEKIDEAEAPYLKGIEVLPLEESKLAMKAADDVCQVVQTAIADARNLIAAKNLEIKKFDPKNVKASIEELTKLTASVNSSAQKLGVFKKDTESRKKKGQMQEAVAMVTSVEATAAKVTEAMKPMMEKNPDDLSPEEASSMVKELEDLEKAASKEVNDCRTFLAARSRDAAGDKEKTKIVTDLNAKVSAAQTELNSAKKLSSTHNEKLRAKALIQDAGEKLKEAEAELEKATTACAPVLEQKCERFLVRNSIATMCAALQAHMDDKGLTAEQMLGEMGKKVKQDKFVAFVGKMPEAFSREECSFSEERRIAMFKSIDVDGDGIVNIDEFKAMFCRKYTCVSGISVTDIFAIAESKTICKLEVGKVVEAVGVSKKAAEGLPRLNIKVANVEGVDNGWVTMQGNSGTKYLELASPFKEFTAQLEKELDVHSKNAGKVSGYLGNKTRDLMSASKESPLQPAKEEVMKTKGKVSQVLQKIEGLKKQVQQAKGEYARMEIKEKNAHIEAKEQKEADAIMAVAKPAVEKVEAELKRLEEAAKPLSERNGTDLLKEFATPLTVQDEVKVIETALKAAVQAAKTVVKEQQEVEQLKKAVKGPVLEAKKELQLWFQKASQASLSGSKLVAMVKSCCTTIAGDKFQLTASTMRTEMRAAGLTVEQLFKKLAKDGDRVSEDNFLKHIQGLAGLNLPLEHAVLLTRRIEVGGIGQRSFLQFLQKYFKAFKDIAITTTFDVIGSKDKPVRKANMDEVFEVLEGPTLDAASGLERIRVKALVDGVEGWVSVKGNQGKVFLTETEKPFFQCLKDTTLEKDFLSGSGDVRCVKSEEVLELLEGPRKETLGSVMRIRGKAAEDSKIGWVTLKDKTGKAFLEKGGKCYTCTATVAITDVFDIKTCKVVKKLAVDEVFTISEGPVAEEGSGVERVKGKTSKGDVEGWITIKGNAGTCYAKVNEKLYTVIHEVAMQGQFKSDSSAVRTLKVGEAVEVMEGPKEEKFEPLNRAKVRTSGDGAAGWISVKSDNVKKWTPLYKFLKAGSLYAEKGSKEGVVREVPVGEVLELQEGPLEIDGLMWLKGQMKKDGALGWTPMKDADGVKMLINSSQPIQPTIKPSGHPAIQPSGH